jgi:ribosomal protein L15
MKVKNLVIERREQYDQEYPNQLVGLVQILGDHGKMEVKLSSSTIIGIFELIADDVEKVAKYNSSQAKAAVEEAGSEVRLISDPSLPF